MDEQRDGEGGRGWRDKPVRQEADKDVKEGGIDGARRDLSNERDPARRPPRQRDRTGPD